MIFGGNVIWSRLILDVSDRSNIIKFSLLKYSGDLELTEILESIKEFAEKYDIKNLGEQYTANESRVESIYSTKGNIIVTINDKEHKIN